MSHTNPGGPAAGGAGIAGRPGLPDPTTVVREFALRAPAPGPAGGPAPSAPGTSAPMPRGQYRVLRTSQVDGYETPPPAAAVGPTPAAPVSDQFTGNARRSTKLSIAKATIEVFADLRDLIDTLPDHEAMTTEHQPPITTASTSKRAPEERRNVRVTAWIYAASRENDNDFHLIVGRDPAASPMYMTMEISGLPPSGSGAHARLEKVRDRYKGFFGNSDAGLPGGTYDFYDPPVPVEIQGSLFFDMSHATGPRPGPKDLRPDMPVVWEVHPVSAIDFEP